MQEAFISVIIPTFNSEKNIDKCLASVVRQSYRAFEIVIVDGGSIDNTITAIQEYASVYAFIHWVSEPDAGIYDAMNKGIQRAKGEWVYFLGSDDRLHDNSVLLNISGELSRLDCDLLYGNVRIMGNVEWAKQDSPYDGEFSVAKLFQKNICHQAIFYRKDVFDRLGAFNIHYRISADWDFNHRCFARGRVKYHDLIVADFSVGGISSTGYDRFITHDFVRVLRQYYRISYFNCLFATSWRIFLNNAKEFLIERNLAKSFYFLFFAWVHSPVKKDVLKTYILWLVKK